MMAALSLSDPAKIALTKLAARTDKQLQKDAVGYQHPDGSCHIHGI